MRLIAFWSLMKCYFVEPRPLIRGLGSLGTISAHDHYTISCVVVMKQYLILMDAWPAMPIAPRSCDIASEGIQARVQAKRCFLFVRAVRLDTAPLEPGNRAIWRIEKSVSS